MTTKSKSPKSSARNFAKNSVIENQKKPPNSFSIINELTCKNLLDSRNVGDIEDILITNFKIESPEINLKSAVIIDFYVNLVIWLKEEFLLDASKFSLIFSAVHYLFDNIRTNQMKLKENIIEFKSMLISRNEISTDSYNGLLSSIDKIELRKINQFLLIGIVQHHKLIEYVFSYNRAQKVLGLDLSVETVPIDSTPYPSPLCESLDSNLFQDCFASDGSIRSHSVKSINDFDEELEMDLDKLDQSMADEMSKFAELSLETISRVLKEECLNVFPIVTGDMENKMQEIESNFLKKFTKQK